ncbi:alpha/beta fold hydrolase [Mesorhizobium australicum]|nr:alpha/beta fold hydrolase [Mesorhizobium australicum]
MSAGPLPDIPKPSASGCPAVVRSGEVLLAAETFGSPSDPALVLVMGATASMMWWPEELCRALAARGFHVVRYDHRDTGRSTNGMPDYSVEEMMQDLVAVLDHYRIERVHLIGTSLGALICQMVALSFPQRVRSLTLIAAEPLGWTGPDLPGMAPEVSAHFGRLATLDWTSRTAVADFMLGVARLCAATSSAFDEKRERLRIEAEMDRAREMRSAFNHSRIGLRGDWSGAIGRIGQPVLVIHGAEDPVVPIDNGRAIASTARNARLLELSGVGHELPERAIVPIVEAIADFVALTDPSN